LNPEVNESKLRVVMTELLEKAFAEAANLPEAEQDELARNLLEDLAVEGKLDHKKRPQFGSAKGSIQMSDDFDDAVQDFAEYME
jgi:Protein of unknown function (DUF2281)